MGLLVDTNPPRQSIKNIKGTSFVQGKALHDKLKATDHLGKIANDESVRVAMEKLDQPTIKFSFQVVVLTCKARIPASGATEVVNLPEELDLLTALQTQWSMK